MVATISSIAAGQCANFLPYTSVLNAPAAQRGAVPCDSAAARIRILSQATNASACTFNGVNDWVEQDGKVTCVQAVPRIGQCFAAWKTPDENPRGFLTFPFDCTQDAVPLGLDTRSPGIGYVFQRELVTDIQGIDYTCPEYGWRSVDLNARICNRAY